MLRFVGYGAIERACSFGKIRFGLELRRLFYGLWKRCRWKKAMSKVESLQNAEVLSRWLHERLDGKTISAASDQVRVGVSLLQHTQDIADAITVLVGSNLPGPALALGRPLIEAYARAVVGIEVC